MVGGHGQRAAGLRLGRGQVIGQAFRRTIVLRDCRPTVDEHFDDALERRRRAGRAPQNGAEEGKPLRVGAKGLR